MGVAFGIGTPAKRGLDGLGVAFIPTRNMGDYIRATRLGSGNADDTKHIVG